MYTIYIVNVNHAFKIRFKWKSKTKNQGFRGDNRDYTLITTKILYFLHALLIKYYNTTMFDNKNIKLKLQI